MLKTTKKINKSIGLFAGLLFSSSGAYAQCPDNITVTNDNNQCGAVVEYAIEGNGAGVSANGIINGNASDGLNGWTSTNGVGTTWIASGGSFISSYNVSTMSQVVDLTSMNLSDTYMDTMPAITVSEDYKGTSNNPSDIYKLTIELRGEANNVLATWTTGNLTGTVNWQTVTHVFTGYPAGVRKVFFQHTGDDAEFWAGNFGTAITNASLTVAIPTATVVQTAGLESGELFPIGTTINTFTVTDEDNVTTTCSFNVIVTDDDAPVAHTQDVIIAELDEDGIATINAAQINNGSTDNCTNLTYTINTSSFTCEDLGENTIQFSVSDGTNTTTVPVIVNVVDVIAPEAIAQNFTIEIDEDGQAVITAEDVNNGSLDNCSIASFTLSKSVFTCEDLGENSVTLTVVDIDGNVDTATAIVTVEDATAPVVITQNIIIHLPQVTIISITAMDINNGSTDNCGISSYSLDNQIFTCENIGENTVTLTVTDNYGNTSTETAIVTVEDPENYCQFAGVDQNLSHAIDLYPNPTHGIVNINATGYNIDKVEFYDINARLVKSFDTKQSTGIFSADINSLNSGIYLIKLYSGNSSASKKIVKQ
ncbi:MAG: T9SS type A sorting domain-containing protein [Bacteroidota bacterium]